MKRQTAEQRRQRYADFAAKQRKLAAQADRKRQRKMKEARRMREARRAARLSKKASA
jgi:hypothetical protein